MVPEIDLPTFAAAQVDGAVVIDVRESFEYAARHVPGARHILASQLPARLAELPTAQPVYVICQSGGRSHAAAGGLRRTGINAISVAPGTGGWANCRRGRPVSNLADGMHAWARAGLPVTAKGGRPGRVA